MLCFKCRNDDSDHANIGKAKLRQVDAGVKGLARKLSNVG
jgi:hypothetical protein